MNGGETQEKPERAARVAALIERAKLLPPDQWPLFLAGEAGDEIDLVDVILEQLRARRQADGFSSTRSGTATPPPPEHDPWVGRKLGDFKIERRIGRGGMGVVFKARQESMARDVAIKVLPFQALANPTRVARFEKEARTAGRLRHPHIIDVHAVGHDGDVHWFAMELVDGPDLAREIRQLAVDRDKPAVRLPAYHSTQYIGTVVDLVCQAADGLSAAHQAGVIHRDVKPSNLLLGPHVSVRLADFGLARDELDPRVTASGDHVGTPHYMSPEQVERSSRVVDARCDVYALGVVLYELLTLRRPFDGKTSGEVWWKILHQSPPPLLELAPRIPPDLATIVGMAMAREPGDRYQTAAALRDDLRRFLAHESIHARPPSLSKRVARVARRHRWPLIAAAVGVLALIAGNAIADWREGWAQEERRRESFSRLVGLAGPPRADEASGFVVGWAGHDDDVVEARQALRELKARNGDSAADSSSLMKRLQALLDADRAAFVAAIRRLDEVALADRKDRELIDGLTSRYSPEAVSEAERLLGIAKHRYGDDAAVQELAAQPRQLVSFTVALSAEAAAAPRASEATVWVRRIDDVRNTLEVPRLLGAVSVGTFRVAPGRQRLIVTIPDWGWSEHTRALEPSANSIVITANVRQSAGLERGMKRIDAGVWKFDEGLPKDGKRDRIPGCSQCDADAPYDAYWIAEAELSNREVADYLDATQAPLPYAWVSGKWCRESWREFVTTFGERWYDLPALGLSIDEFTAVAEWHGYRLPTHVELERALRGIKRQRNPWLDEQERVAGVAGKANVDRPQLPAELKLEDLYAATIPNLLPVREPGYQQAPEGLFHAFGNVSEWTESRLVEPFRGRAEIFSTHLHLGMAWDAVSENQVMALHAPEEASPRYIKTFVGVRLARTADSPGTAPGGK